MQPTGSVYSTLAVAIERYFSVCRPHIIPPYYTGNLVVFTLGLFAFAFNFLRFFDFRTAYITVVGVKKMSRTAPSAMNDQGILRSFQYSLE